MHAFFLFLRKGRSEKKKIQLFRPIKQTARIIKSWKNYYVSSLPYDQVFEKSFNGLKIHSGWYRRFSKLDDIRSSTFFILFFFFLSSFLFSLTVMRRVMIFIDFLKVKKKERILWMYEKGSLSFIIIKALSITF